jgi:hypothetical protein
MTVDGPLEDLQAVMLIASSADKERAQAARVLDVGNAVLLG